MKRFEEIKEERRRRTEEEKAAGAARVKRTMMEGVVDQLRKELDPRFLFDFSLLTPTNDPRNWAVRVDFKNGQAHSESFFLFPTDELRTKIMLFSGR